MKIRITLEVDYQQLVNHRNIVGKVCNMFYDAVDFDNPVIVKIEKPVVKWEEVTE